MNAIVLSTCLSLDMLGVVLSSLHDGALEHTKTGSQQREKLCMTECKLGHITKHQTLNLVPQLKDVISCVRSYLTALVEGIKRERSRLLLTEVIKSILKKLASYKVRPV
jgi:hypothetical protein